MGGIWELQVIHLSVELHTHPEGMVIINIENAPSKRPCGPMQMRAGILTSPSLQQEFRQGEMPQVGWRVAILGNQPIGRNAGTHMNWTFSHITTRKRFQLVPGLARSRETRKSRAKLLSFREVK